MLDKTDPFFHLLDHSTLSGGALSPTRRPYNRPALAKEASVLALRAKNLKSDSALFLIYFILLGLAFLIGIF